MGCLRVVCWFVLCVVEGDVSLWCFWWCFLFGSLLGLLFGRERGGVCGVSFGFSRGMFLTGFLMVFCLWLGVLALGVLWCVLA